DCDQMLVNVTVLHSPSPILYLSLSDTNILIDPTLNIAVGEARQLYAVRGLIYSDGEHFTSRIIKPNGSVRYHDGIET
ncbi:hypothetical protein B0H13DRAFT_1469063, partial [Mycena leptocephala]